MKRNGFTLIELLVVVAIIGILAAVGVVAYNGYTGAAKIKTLQTLNFHIQKEPFLLLVEPFLIILIDTHVVHVVDQRGINLNLTHVWNILPLKLKCGLV